jgi:hypothetical protein
MKISCIHVSTCKRDYHLTQCCIASIRHWYPEIPIYLIKDHLEEDFDTSELEKAWNVSLFTRERRLFGTYWGKIEALLSTPPQRSLIIDSDIVLAGPVLDQLDNFEEDFIVAYENHPLESIEKEYFSIPLLCGFDPEFNFPGFVFNSGQIVATTGLLTLEDIRPYICDALTSEMLRPDVFKVGDQSLLNYLLLKKSSQGSISLRRHPYMSWGPSPWLKKLSLIRIYFRSPYSFLIHWAGKKSPDLGELAHSYLLKFYFWKYHLRVPGGWWKYFLRRYRQKQSARKLHAWTS